MYSAKTLTVKYTCLLTKYTDPNAQGNGANVSIPLIRYTDAMLIYSEACARVANSPNYGIH